MLSQVTFISVALYAKHILKQLHSDYRINYANFITNSTWIFKM